jgi:SAM-dependent methyltransferase
VAFSRFPPVAAVIYHPKVRSATKSLPGFKALYGKGWLLPHPFDRLHRTDTSGMVSPDQLPNSPFASTRIHVYAGSQPSIVRTALRMLPPLAGFTFVDFGCGKGRPLLVASEFPFRDIVGVELSPDLAGIARTNLAVVAKRYPERTSLRVEIADAATFPIPSGKVVIFLYNPFDEAVMLKVIAAIEAALAAGNSLIYVVYYNPVFGACFDRSTMLTRYFAGTIPYSDEERGYGPDTADSVVIWHGGTPRPPLRGADAKIKVVKAGLRAEVV